MWWPRPSAVGEYVLLADVPEVLILAEHGQRVKWTSEFFLGVGGVLRGHLPGLTSLTCRAALLRATLLLGEPVAEPDPDDAAGGDLGLGLGRCAYMPAS